MPPKIRLAKLHELDIVLEVENKAGERFRALDMEPKDDGELEPFIEERRTGIKEQRLWVAVIDGAVIDGAVIDGAVIDGAVIDGAVIVGFALAEELDEMGHLREIDVLQEYGRQGIGRTLIKQVIQWSQNRQYPAVTLTTYRDVPWNCPYYEKLGFRVLEEDELHGKLAERLKRERSHSPMARVAMAKTILTA